MAGQRFCKCGCGGQTEPTLYRGSLKFHRSYIDGHRPTVPPPSCGCGCEQPVAPILRGNGERVQWAKYAKGHAPTRRKLRPCKCGCGEHVPVGPINRWYIPGHRPRKTKPCACGCGQMINGRRLYIPEHRPLPLTATTEGQAKMRASSTHTKPVGYRRMTRMKEKYYWQIKTADGWKLEHRHIIEQQLGQELRTNEHVHHRDNNGLNNGKHADGDSNLQLLSASEHMRLTQKTVVVARCHCVCPHCGSNLHHVKKIHSPRTTRRRAPKSIINPVAASLVAPQQSVDVDGEAPETTAD